MYSNVAAYITRDFVARYGTERIRAWLNYQRAIRATTPLTDLGGILLRVPLEGGWSKTRPLSDCNVDEVRRTTRAGRDRPKTRVAVTDAVRTLFLGESVSQHFKDVKDVAAIRFNVRNKDGKAFVTLADVPVAEMERLLQALLAGLEEAQPATLRAEKKQRPPAFLQEGTGVARPSGGPYKPCCSPRCNKPLSQSAASPAADR